MAEAVVAGLLQAYSAMWHWHAAQYWEEILVSAVNSTDSDDHEAAGCLILAHHWAAAAVGQSRAARGRAATAAVHVRRAARVAVVRGAYRPAVQLLQASCSLLALVPPHIAGAQNGMRRELLCEMAPCVLVVHGPASREAVAAYQGLTRLVPLGPALDHDALLVLAGTCAILASKGLVEPACRLAEDIIARSTAPRHIAAGLALLLPLRFRAGDLEGVLELANQLRKGDAGTRCGTSAPSSEAAAAATGMVNGVFAGLAYGLQPWSRGEAARAKAAQEEVLSTAEAAGHTPTLFYVLHVLGRHYVRPAAARVADYAAAEALARCADSMAARAEALAEAQRTCSLCTAGESRAKLQKWICKSESIGWHKV